MHHGGEHRVRAAEGAEQERPRFAVALVTLRPDRLNPRRVVARVSPRTRVAVGQEIELAVDTSRLYFFDPENRDAI